MSIRPPKLLQPSPTAETLRPDRPRLRCSNEDTPGVYADCRPQLYTRESGVLDPLRRIKATLPNSAADRGPPCLLAAFTCSEAGPKLPAKGALNRGDTDAAACVYRERRSRAGGRGGARSARDRAIATRDQGADGPELAEKPGYAIWGGRVPRETGGRGDRQSVPDPCLRRRRNRAGAAGPRRGAEQHGRDGPHRELLLHRQGPDLQPRLHDPVRDELPADERLDDACRRAGAVAQVLRRLQHIQHSGRQYRGADGRLVPQGDQDR